MTLLHMGSQKIKPFLSSNFTVYDEEIARNKYSIEEKSTVFIKRNDTYLHAFLDRDNVRYFPCQVIASDTTIKQAIQLFQKNVTLLLVEDENVKGFITSSILLHNIFNRHEKLAAYLDTILNTIDESCTVIDQDKRVQFWTKGAEKLFSVKREEIIGKPITDYFDAKHLEILNALDEGTSVYQQQHQAREDVVVLINSNPVYLHDEIIGAVVSEYDITSHIRLNQELYQTSEKLFTLEQTINNDDPFKYIRGNSEKLNQLKTRVEKASRTDTNILILGESGVGKELFAKAIHQLREEKNAPFIPINCGAIPAALFESEIFGYEKGAFSGAHQHGKKGKAELAKNGTLFLDEIGEMPLDMQVKMLRLLQEKKFFPVGGTREIEVDFRVIAATNKDLKQLVKEGKFREDLYYRLNVVSLEIPPLRKRPSDIIELTHYFLNEMSIKYERPIHGISQSVMQALLNYDWPGNIRELKNVIERLVVFSEQGTIKLEDLPFEVHESKEGKILDSYSGHNQLSLKEQLQKNEKEIIMRELRKVRGNKKQCAENLDITRATLYNRMRMLDIDI